jgi:hypothetical protein
MSKNFPFSAKNGIPPVVEQFPYLRPFDYSPGVFRPLIRKSKTVNGRKQDCDPAILATETINYLIDFTTVYETSPWPPPCNLNGLKDGANLEE